jgi:hypothetical protein
MPLFSSTRVTYREFDGPHTVTPAIGREALHWFVGDRTLIVP